jgi:hypothetical protein
MCKHLEHSGVNMFTCLYKQYANILKTLRIETKGYFNSTGIQFHRKRIELLYQKGKLHLFPGI